MRISIFGMGYVGAVSAACFTELGHEVVGVDVNADKVRALNEGISPVVEAGVGELIRSAAADGRVRATDDCAEAVAATDLSLVCVGTPSNAAGELTLVAVEAVVADIGRAIRAKDADHALVIRSTVVPGTTEGRLAPLLEEHSGRKIGAGVELAFNPEFLREGSAVKDFYAPPFTIIGSLTEGGYRAVEAVYAKVDAPAIRTEIKVAESVKFLSNAFHALKIAFANEAGALLKDMGADAREAMRLFCEDRQLNISPAYLRPGFAFGGSCLPKELRAFQALAKRRDVDVPMLASVLASNARHVDRGFELVAKHGRQKVALFGLSFKPGTDDLRESPLVSLAERLLGRGFELSIFDESLELGRLLGANRDFIEREIPHLDRLLAVDAATCMDGAGILVVGHAPQAVVEHIAANHAGRPIVDLAGIARLQALDVANYEGICW